MGFDSILRTISTDKAPKAIGPYSQAIEVGGMIFCSGQIAINPRTGNIETKTIEEQTEQVLRNLEAVLKEAGTDLSHVVRCTVFLADLSEFAAFNKTYGSFFTSNPPSRSTVQVAKLPRDAKVEIDAIAYK
jgi:2-iminobutanoate/2-iminopropanoate deaminase